LIGGRATGAPGCGAVGRGAGAGCVGAGGCAGGAEGIDGCGDDGGANGDMRGAAAGAGVGAAAVGAVGAGGTAGARGGVSRDGAGIAGRSLGGVTAEGREGMLVSADVRGGGCVAAPDCAANAACIGCGGVGIDTGGRGGSGADTDGRWRGGVTASCDADADAGAGAEAVKSSSMRPRSPIAITPPHTEQRARTPARGIFAGSTRNTELHSGQVTFMRRRSRESVSHHRSETPTGEPRIGSCRRSTTYTDPLSVFA